MIWRIGEILIQKKLLTWEQLEDALDEQKKTKEFTGEILMRKKYISPALFYKTLAEQYSMRFIDLKKIHINPRVIQMVPKVMSEQYLLLPVDMVQKTLHIAIANPMNAWPEGELKKLTGADEVKAVLALPDDIRLAVKENYDRAVRAVAS